MCHANRAASAGPDATRRCNSRIFFEPRYGLGGLNRWAPQYLPLPPARQAVPPNYC